MNTHYTYIIIRTKPNLLFSNMKFFFPDLWLLQNSTQQDIALKSSSFFHKCMHFIFKPKILLFQFSFFFFFNCVPCSNVSQYVHGLWVAVWIHNFIYDFDWTKKKKRISFSFLRYKWKPAKRPFVMKNNLFTFFDLCITL